MNGGTYYSIVKELTARGIKTPRGNDEWQIPTIRNILTNETYRGSKRLQKTFCTNYLTKKNKINEGELPMYYIEKSHELIIPQTSLRLCKLRSSVEKKWAVRFVL